MGSLSGQMDPAALRNRLLLATGMWRSATDEPLPKMAPGDPELQLQAFELRLVEMLCVDVAPDAAAKVADQTWDLVHDRPEEDPVRRKVVECHERLARLSAGSGGEAGTDA